MGSTAMTLSQTIQKVPKCGQKTGLDGKSSCFTLLLKDIFFFFPLDVLPELNYYVNSFKVQDMGWQGSLSSC